MKKIIILGILSGLLATSAFAERCENFDEAVAGGNNLDLSRCSISDTSIDEIIRYANSHSNITSINLYNNFFHDSSVKKLVDLKYVTDLDLAYNRLSDESARILGASKNLTWVDLSGNNITDDGLAAFVANKNMRLMGFSHTRITDKSANLLAQSRANYIDVEYNGLGDETAIALASDKTLTQLHISDNNIGVKGIQALDQAMQENPSLLIDYFGNPGAPQYQRAMKPKEATSKATK